MKTGKQHLEAEDKKKISICRLCGSQKYHKKLLLHSGECFVCDGCSVMFMNLENFFIRVYPPAKLDAQEAFKELLFPPDHGMPIATPGARGK